MALGRRMLRSRNVFVLGRIGRVSARFGAVAAVAAAMTLSASAQTELQAEVSPDALQAVDPLAEEPDVYRVGHGDVPLTCQSPLIMKRQTWLVIPAESVSIQVREYFA